MNSASSAAALVFYLPFSDPCTQRNARLENRERPESLIYLKIFEKNTIFNEHPVYTRS